MSPTYRSNRYSIALLLGATSILWITRPGFQLTYPQGSMKTVRRYGMLAASIAVTLRYLVALFIVLSSSDGFR